MTFTTTYYNLTGNHGEDFFTDSYIVHLVCSTRTIKEKSKDRKSALKQRLVDVNYMYSAGVGFSKYTFLCIGHSFIIVSDYVTYGVIKGELFRAIAKICPLTVVLDIVKNFAHVQCIIVNPR